MVKSGSRRKRYVKLRRLTEDQKLEIAKQLVASRNLKEVAFNNNLAYSAVYYIFRVYVDVVWQLREKPVQGDLFEGATILPPS